MTANILIQEGQNSRRVSRIEGVVLRQLQSALKGSDRAAMAVVKMALQLGFLEDPDSNSSEINALSNADEQILEQLMARHQETKRR
jgi:hypothetical protein